MIDIESYTNPMATVYLIDSESHLFCAWRNERGANVVDITHFAFDKEPKTWVVMAHQILAGVDIYDARRMPLEYIYDGSIVAFVSTTYEDDDDAYTAWAADHLSFNARMAIGDISPTLPASPPIPVPGMFLEDVHD
jgi:hypothetical protein